MTTPVTINRENGPKSKGFRLQKLRAARLMLNTIESCPNALFYSAIEVLEDVALITYGTEGCAAFFEEDKNGLSRCQWTQG